MSALKIGNVLRAGLMAWAMFMDLNVRSGDNYVNISQSLVGTSGAAALACLLALSWADERLPKAGLRVRLAALFLGVWQVIAVSVANTNDLNQPFLSSSQMLKAAVLALGVFLRWSYLPNLAADLEFMNSAWYDAIREGGMKAALAPELLYTYSPLHLYLWRLESLLLPGVSTYTALKGCSLLFEVLNLIVVYSLLKTALPKEKQSWG